MRWKQKWASVVMAAALLVPLVPAVQAEAAEPEVRNLARGLDYTWSEAPEAAYPDNNRKLTDGIYGQLDRQDPAWVGHVKKMTREVVFDLGEKKSISAIKARFLQDWPTNSILVPLSVSMYVSDDNTNWGALTHQATQLLWGDGPPRQETFEWDGQRDGILSGHSDSPMAYARYVKVVFPMHTRAWTLIDEVEIWGADGKREEASTVPADPVGLLQPGEATAGIHNLGLLYNGHYPDNKGDWTKERIIPNISYVNQAGEPVDQLFDGVLYLGLTAPSGRGFDGNANLEDWTWYLDKTFAANGDMQQLNEATKEVGIKLGQPGMKEKVVLMIPDPGEWLDPFGVVNGESLSFNASAVGEEKAFANRVKAVQWWLDQVQAKWEQANYSHLELVGMYWLEEQVSTSKTGPDLLRAVGEQVHAKDLTFFWIPHFLAYKSYMWQEVGIDAVAFQPNYFFEEMDIDRLEDAANIAKRYGMSLELEFDDRMLTDGVFRERYIDYLNSGVDTGLMQNGFKAYYQGNDAVRNTAVSADPATRVLYDWLYQFVKGTYEKNDALPPEAEVRMNGKPLQSGAVLPVPDTEPVQFTWQLPNDDEGYTKVTATFDGKPYTEGTDLNLTGKLGKHELIVTVTAGKSQKTSYVIEAGVSPDRLKSLVNEFAADNQITHEKAVRSLLHDLDMMKQFEQKNRSHFERYVRDFHAKLETLKEHELITAAAYDTLNEGVYYLIGNLAQNKAAEASSVESDKADYAAGKAVDGFPASRWASEYQDNTWFQIDLGQTTTIDTITIDWEYARANTYQLLVSTDKQTWTPVVPDNNGIISAHDGKQTISCDPVQARYVKFQGIQRATDYGYSFYEFGVYHLDGGKKKIPGLN